MMEKKLTRRQRAFAEAYIQCGNATEAARRSGYSEKNADVTGARLLVNVSISEYIDRRIRAQDEAQVASSDEVMRFFSSVMRGEVKDQFGLDASLADRLNAGKELMKRYAAANGMKSVPDVPVIIDRRPDE